MNTYARVENSVVVELLSTDGDIHAMFHRQLLWIDAAEAVGVAIGWHYDGSALMPTAPVVESKQDSSVP
jgi:hypothetical protein